MDNEPSVTTEQLKNIGRLVIEILQSAANEGIEQMTVGDMMRTFGFESEEADEWDDVVLVFVKDEGNHTFNQITVIH